jgi:outer membrane lipoprotein-sorting protein
MFSRGFAPTIVAVAALVAASVERSAQAQADAHAILASSDAIRNPDDAFAIDVQLIEYRRGKQSDAMSLTVFSKPAEHTGAYRSLIQIRAPARDVNKLFLQDGVDLWFYDPSSQASIRISPQQRLLGQAANGDVVSTNFARDYAAELAGEEDIQDGERQTRSCFRLKLSASAAATYDSIVMWIERDTFRPVRGRFYSASGELLKTAYYRRFSTELGVDRPTETVIIDGLDDTWITVMRYSNYRATEIPESWLQREYLNRFASN